MLHWQGKKKKKINLINHNFRLYINLSIMKIKVTAKWYQDLAILKWRSSPPALKNTISATYHQSRTIKKKMICPTRWSPLIIFSWAEYNSYCWQSNNAIVTSRESFLWVWYLFSFLSTCSLLQIQSSEGGDIYITLPLYTN